MCATDPIKTTYGNKTLWIDCATCKARTRPMVTYLNGSTRPEDRKIQPYCEACGTYGKIVKIELRERDASSPGKCDARCLNGRKSCNCRCMGRCHGAGVCSCDAPGKSIERKKTVDIGVNESRVIPMERSKYSTIRNAENLTIKHADELACRLHAAAEKAGFGEALASMRVGVIWSGGKYVVDYEPEVAEAGIEIDHDVLDRARAWLDRATKRA